MLSTDRLRLERPSEQDFPAMLAFGRSERTRFVGGKAARFDVWRGLLAGIGHWQLRGYGLFTVCLAATGERVGRVGVIYHDGWAGPELSWHLYDGHERQGYATEAARAARDWYHAERGDRPLISYIHHENAPSQAVARRLGAVVEREAELLGAPCQIWRHPAPEAPR